MIAIVQFRPSGDEQLDGDGDSFQAQAQAVLRAFAARPGYLDGRLGRAADDPQAWVLVTEWGTVGDYRRALGGYDVKLTLTPLMACALNEPSAYEVLAAVSATGSETIRASDRADVEAGI